MALNYQLYAQQGSLGLFENHSDIGKVKHQGSVYYDLEGQEYLIEGSGKNMWFDEDQFHYLWKSIQGDFILRAKVKFIGKGINPHRKIGWMVRNSLHTDAPHVNASLHGDGLLSLQFRKKKGADTEEIISRDSFPDIIQLERKGNRFIMGTAKMGEPLEQVELNSLDLKNEVFVGLYVCSHDPEILEKAIFSNVRIIKPFMKPYEPYEDYLGSNMEILDIESGQRKILFSSSHSLQAPNWSLDGKSLIYNSNGYLYQYNLEDQKISMINTGFAIQNNNDHVISLDGKQMGISHHDEDDNNDSAIYVLPIEGNNTPLRITKKGSGASYLHGWSNDAKELVFTGHRNGKYDIYKVAIDTGKEVQLTDTQGLDDGSEYSPDGKYIYFNSNRTGTMQIWRMRPDGSAQEQLTFDEFNDWFPHVSPDGKKIVFLSYGKEVPSDDHPFYQQVYIRILPVSGGTPKILSYVFGGQGTMNVASWSPDSKRIAFVSNTGN